MKKSLLAFCLAMATLSLSAQEVLDFSQPDPVSATPVRSTKLLRFAPNFRVYNTYFRGGFENSASLNVFNLEFRPWRNQHYFNAGLGVDYGSAYLGSRYYSISGDVLSFDPVKDGSLSMDRMGLSLPFSYGFDIAKRKSLEFTVTPHYWPVLRLTNEYKSGSAAYEYAKAQGLVKDGNDIGISTFYQGHNPFTVDFSLSYYLTANTGLSFKYEPPIQFKKGTGPSFHAFSIGAVIRF